MVDSCELSGIKGEIEPGLVRTQMAYCIGDQPIPGYQLLEILGEGGFGVVWKASGPGRVHVALKIINLGRKQGLKEFKALALIKSIHHPNLVPIHSFWLKDEDGKLLGDAALDTTPAELAEPLKKTLTVEEARAAKPTELLIAMGLGDKTLSDRLEECRSSGLPGIPLAELLDYMENAGRAIDFLNSPRHVLGDGRIGTLQHCDIKPHNIVIVGGDAQVCDFGLVRVLSDIRMTSGGVSMAYGAPECIANNAPSSSTDQYSLAISYVELRCGELPFEDSKSLNAVMHSHLSGKLDFSRLSSSERKVIRRATALDPARRFANVLQMVHALRDATRDQLDVPASSEYSDPAFDSVSGPPTPTRPRVAAVVAARDTRRLGLDDTSDDGKQEAVPRLTRKHARIAIAVAALLVAGWGVYQSRRIGTVAIESTKKPAPGAVDRGEPTLSTSNLLSLAGERIAAAKQLLKAGQEPQLVDALAETEKADQLLGEIAASDPEATVRGQADDLVRQSLLLRLRARSRQARPAADVFRTEQEELAALPSLGDGAPPTRRALEPMLLLICSSVAEQEDYDRSLPRLGTARTLARRGGSRRRRLDPDGRRAEDARSGQRASRPARGHGA